ncbi:hypothetical protein ZWY2020_022517 [Hordeum vulgare]|nr:hypothetical protein ZWY2020_022517 [Hordeum vulgare]
MTPVKTGMQLRLRGGKENQTNEGAQQPAKPTTILALTTRQLVRRVVGGPVGLRQRPGSAGAGAGGKKQGGGVEKTKAAAARGLKKVKEGTAHGFQWIKGKVQKKKQGAAGAGDDAAAGY